jgi:hypothetical protein
MSPRRVKNIIKTTRLCIFLNCTKNGKPTLPPKYYFLNFYSVLFLGTLQQLMRGFDILGRVKTKKQSEYDSDCFITTPI